MTEKHLNTTGTMKPNTTQGPSLHSLPEKTAIIVAYSLVVLLAVPANSLVIFVIAKVRAMQNSANVVLLNLCAADLLIALLYLPFTTVDLYVKGYWVFGDVMCPLVSFLHSVAVSALILFLITIAVERYRRVCLRGRSQLTVKQTWAIVAVLWLLASCASCPQLVVKRVTQDEAWPVCVETWTHSAHGKVYTLVMFALFYLIPLVFLIIIYLRIARKFWRSATRTRSMRLSRRPAASSKSRLTRISVVLVLSFAFSWAPSHALTLWYYLRDNEDYPDVVAVLYPIVSWTASLNCALNPLLYCFMSNKFRNSFSELWKRSSRSRSSETDAVEPSRPSKWQRKQPKQEQAYLKEADMLEMVACVYESSV